MRIFSSAENYRRVARRMSLITALASFRAGPDVCFIFEPRGYDEPAILRLREPSICLRSAAGGQPFAASPLSQSVAAVGLRKASRPDRLSCRRRHRGPIIVTPCRVVMRNGPSQWGVTR